MLKFIMINVVTLNPRVDGWVGGWMNGWKGKPD
jgi:hypothetical protein